MTRKQKHIVNVLKKAKGMIDTPEKWCQGISCTDNRICGLCALQAIYVDDCTSLSNPYDRVPSLQIAKIILDKIAPEYVGDIAYYNDTHTHAEVMAFFDLCIAEASNAI